MFPLSPPPLDVKSWLRTPGLVINGVVCRQQLKVSLNIEADDSAQVLESMAADVLVSGNVHPPSYVEKAVDAVTLDTVNKV